MPGAGGILRTSRVVHAAPDGYTLSLGHNGSHVVTGATYALQFDLLKDFEPVALLSFSQFVLVARKTIPANDLKGLIAWLKANPDKATQGHAGVGGAAHVVGLLLQKETGTRFQSVPYRGGAQAMQDLVAGQIDMVIADPVGTLEQVRSGNVKAYAVMAKTRLAAASDIPTVDEARESVMDRGDEICVQQRRPLRVGDRDEGHVAECGIEGQAVHLPPRHLPSHPRKPSSEVRRVRDRHLIFLEPKSLLIA